MVLTADTKRWEAGRALVCPCSRPGHSSTVAADRTHLTGHISLGTGGWDCALLTGFS